MKNGNIGTKEKLLQNLDEYGRHLRSSASSSAMARIR